MATLTRQQQLLHYILGVARDEADIPEGLGRIHILKYMYLADLAYAERTGESGWSGTEWQFYHYGPWSPRASLEIARSGELFGAHQTTGESARGNDGALWRLPDTGNNGYNHDIPLEIRLLLRRLIKEYRRDTRALLHHVYLTQPMLSAAPGERLDLRLAHRPPETPLSPEIPALTPRQRKLRNQKIQATRERLQQRRAQRTTDDASRIPIRSAPPLYDEIFEKGTAWLDAQAGQPISEGAFTLEVDDEVWKSPMRREKDVG